VIARSALVSMKNVQQIVYAQSNGGHMTDDVIVVSLCSTQIAPTGLQTAVSYIMVSCNTVANVSFVLDSSRIRKIDNFSFGSGTTRSERSR